MQKIRKLSANLINKIAAGEVIERPASVVKELIENAIDAKANSIKISLIDGGISQISVSDNGFGIAKEDLKHAVLRHATSKIEKIDDLDNLKTMGFRGEGLSSISSVANMVIASRAQNANNSWQIETNFDDQNYKIKPSLIQKGSKIDVFCLFANLPARRKFLKTFKTESFHVEILIKKIALIHPQIEFIFYTNNRLQKHYKIEINNNKNRIKSIFGPEFLENFSFAKLVFASGIAKIYQYPIESNKVPMQFIYVNKRPIKDKIINHALNLFLNQNYIDKKLSYFLDLKISSDLVDFNVHPQKQEVRFSNQRYIHEIIFDLAKKAYLKVKQKTTKQIDITKKHGDKIVVEQVFALKNLQFKNQQKDNNHQQNNDYFFEKDKNFQQDLISYKEQNRNNKEQKNTDLIILAKKNHTQKLINNEKNFINSKSQNLSFWQNIENTFFALDKDVLILKEENSLKIIDLHLLYKNYLKLKFEQILINSNKTMLLLPWKLSITREEKVIFCEYKKLLNTFSIDYFFREKELVLTHFPSFFTPVNYSDIFNLLLLKKESFSLTDLINIPFSNPLCELQIIKNTFLYLKKNNFDLNKTYQEIELKK